MLTVGEIKDILRKERISISKRRGQNFLVDAQIKRKIIDTLDIKADDEVLEIGPGFGALTEDLAQGAGRVFAVEKDRALARTLQKMLARYGNLQIIHQDILKTNFAQLTKQKVKVLGNLPYYITTPIIGYLLEQQLKNIKEILITVQYEVARRLVATTGTKDYSALTIFVQYFTKPEQLFPIPKRAFYPQPKVDSEFVRLKVLTEPSVKVNLQERFFKIVRSCFSQRRKTILNSLTHQLPKTERPQIQQILKETGVDFQARPERLSLEQFAKIEDAFNQKGVKF